MYTSSMKNIFKATTLFLLMFILSGVTLGQGHITYRVKDATSHIGLPSFISIEHNGKRREVSTDKKGFFDLIGANGVYNLNSVQKDTSILKHLTN
jgi:hypothetical protein